MMTIDLTGDGDDEDDNADAAFTAAVVSVIDLTGDEEADVPQDNPPSPVGAHQSLARWVQEYATPVLTGVDDEDEVAASTAAEVPIIDLTGDEEADEPQGEALSSRDARDPHCSHQAEADFWQERSETFRAPSASTRVRRLPSQPGRSAFNTRQLLKAFADYQQPSASSSSSSFSSSSLLAAAATLPPKPRVAGSLQQLPLPTELHPLRSH